VRDRTFVEKEQVKIHGHASLWQRIPEGHHEHQTIAHLEFQVQGLSEAGHSLPAKGLGLFAYPALPGHLQLRRSDAACDRREGCDRFFPGLGRDQLVASSLSARPALEYRLAPNQVLRLRGLHSGALLSVRWDF
jgi:hypothetical protein